MVWMLTGDTVLTNVETTMVFMGTVTFWTDNVGKSMMIVRNPDTGNEDRQTITAPGPWWIIQHQMQIMEEAFSGTPLLEVKRKVGSGMCRTCGGAGGGYDKDQNWIECPECS